ncbi:MAG: glycosyltransferase family 2 protein [Sulfuricurvum sp.]|nr:glycosyltransferase family 2 protein [Sulfuricurvum sp.]MDD5387141.1 glycosyltransferase family 2 protein [Sulfuricurvum sp.]
MYDLLFIIIIIVQLIIFIYFLILNSTYTLFTFFALSDIIRREVHSSRFRLQQTLSTSFYRPISLIVPAYNEQATIVSSIRSQLALHYPEFEIIIVNDGSNDETVKRLIDAFDFIPIEKPIKLEIDHQQIQQIYISLQNPNLWLIDKNNGGKFDAINCGINVCNYPLFCVVDADSLLEYDSLLRAGSMFAHDKEVVAVGGTVRPLNGCEILNGQVITIKTPRKWIELFQSVEYTRGFLAGRSAWNLFDALLIISGAFGIFRKDIVLKIGGYRHTVGEDMDLVVRIHRHCIDNAIPYKILSIPDPICWTQVPDDWISLMKQRNRWHRGLIDVLWYNKIMIFNPKYGKVGTLGMTYFLFVEALGPTIELVGYISFFIFYFFGLIDRQIGIYIFLFAFTWGVYITLSSIFLDNFIHKRYSNTKDLFKLSFFGILESIGYRQLMTIERFIATFQFWRKGWGKIIRKEITILPQSVKNDL